MFNRVPRDDAYSLKMILHDWDDQECIKILSNLCSATSQEAGVCDGTSRAGPARAPHFKAV
jgi:O-methyltransferase domain